MMHFTPRLRRMIKERDRGICAICQLDVITLEQKVKHAVWQGDVEAMQRIRAQLRPEMLRKLDLHGARKTLWEVDHQLPLAEGGQHVMENLRTLCSACHAEETAKLARRRRKAG
jgi:5-methylcytosine-specific restriction endonuclease McrA